jgi:hypothetical protein
MNGALTTLMSSRHRNQRPQNPSQLLPRINPRRTFLRKKYVKDFDYKDEGSHT